MPRSLSILLLAAFATLVAACAAPDATDPPPGAAVTPEAASPEAAKPEPAPAAAAEAPADPLAAHLPPGLKAAPWTVHDAMELFEDAHAEERLDLWTKSPPSEFGDVARLAATALAVAERTDWSADERRAKNPSAFDGFVAGLKQEARQLGLAALAADPNLVAARADRLAQRCADCHLAGR